MAFAAGLSLACHPADSRPADPAVDLPETILLVTLDGLRAESIGTPWGQTWAPRLAELAAAAEWSGRAIVASPDGLASLASLQTGLGVWQHQLLSARLSSERPALRTLAVALSERGYATSAWIPSTIARRPLLVHGFDQVRRSTATEALSRALAQGAAEDTATRAKATTEAGQFHWVHLPQPAPPFVLRASQAAALPAALVERLPARRTAAEVRGIEAPPGSAARRELRASYGLNLALADHRVGGLIDALRASGRWSRSLVVLTSTHGTALGRRRSELGRDAIEVPLLIKLPEGPGRTLAAPDTERVEQRRLWATVWEAVGGVPRPAQAPSLWAAGATPILTEHYFADGANRFSLLDGDLQLEWASRYAGQPGERVASGTKASLARAKKQFLITPPLSGAPRSKAQRRLWRWRGGGREMVRDPERERAMALELERLWLRFTGGERSPRSEARPSRERG